MNRRIVVRTAMWIITVTLCFVSAAVAQAPSLDRVEELSRFGRPEEARDMLLGWWAESSDGASPRDQQRALWLRARLTVDPSQAVLDYRRLVVLYPRGEYTARALFRLAQAAHEMGDDETARGHVRMLASDFREAPARREAEAWLREAGPAPPAPEGGGVGSATTETAPPPPSRPEPAGDAEAADIAGDGFYYVQLGAFAEEVRAMAVFDQAVAAGVEARIVRVDGSQFLHVRVGRFRQRADAAAEVERVAERGLIAALVRDERPERVIRN